jgi:hypothetical protein
MAAQDKVTFKQDLTEPVKIRHYEGVVFTGDDCGNLIKVALFDGGTPYSGGGTVSATAVLADGTTFPLTQGSITGNMVSVPLEAGALAVSGLMGLYVKISGGGIICTVLNAIFTVQATDTGMVPAAMVTTVNELVAAIRDAQDSIPADLTNLLAAVAPTFSTSTAYSAGAYVWQGGKLYRFTAAHPAGTWTGTGAVEVALGNDVADLKSALVNFNSYDLLKLFGEYVSRTNRGVTYTWNAEKTECTATGTASGISTTTLYSSTSSLPSELVPGEKYIVSVESTSEYLFLDSYWYYDGGNTHELFYTSREFTVPQNCIGAILRIRVLDGNSVNNAVIRVSVRDTKTNKELEDEINGLVADRLYQGVLSTLGYTSCNDVWKSGLYFVSSEAPIDKYPFPSGYLFVESSSNNESSVGTLQIAYAYGASFAYPKFRKKVSTTWTDWHYFDEFSRENVTKIFNDLFKYGSYDAALYGAGSSGTQSGLTYTNNGDGTWLINGTVADGDESFRNIITGNTTLPEYIVVGRKYTIHKSGNELVRVQIFLYNSSGSSSAYYEDGDKVLIPDGTTGIIVRFKVNGPATLENEVITVSMVAEISDVEQTIVNQEIHNDTFNNTYNITTSPQITTDTNGWLQPVDTASADETDKTDMSGAIMSMLNSTGYCHLAPGVFYVSGFDMPDKSTLVGCGKQTEIRLLSSVTNGYAIKIQKYCTVKDLSIYGSYSALDYNSFTADKGTRHGIVFNAQYAEGTSQSEYCVLSNIFIHSFTGCGIKCYNTSISTHRGLYASQIYISICQTGLFVEFHSEFNKFEQICTRYCYVACENNGGNNTFVSCTFHSMNTGFLIDNSLGDKANNSHGSLIGCTFCHIGSNQGLAIAVKGATNGYVFSGCQIWYCSILVENSNGIVFSNMEFGRGTTGGGATIRINGGDTVMFTGCVFMNDVPYPPDIVITDNTKVRFNSCYGSISGNAITGT